MLPGGGNSVAAYTEKEVICPECEGNKKIYFSTRTDLRWYLERHLVEWEKVYHAYFEGWRKDKTIECPACEGEGIVTIIS
jgi:ssDNA-binding Zn-finger/Zn-ribbon topoisomerase 1